MADRANSTPAPDAPLMLYPPHPSRPRALLASLQRLAVLADALTTKYLEACDQEDGDADCEPDLGSVGGTGLDYAGFTRRTGDQRRWAQGVDLDDQCEDEGIDTDREEINEDGGGSDGNMDMGWCNWQDEGDQTKLRMLPFTPARGPVARRHAWDGHLAYAQSELARIKRRRRRAKAAASRRPA